MFKILNQRNEELRKQIKSHLSLISNTKVINELKDYRKKIIAICIILESQISKNIILIDLMDYDLLEEIISNTNQIIKWKNFLSSYFFSPILHSKKTDKIILKTISWLHKEHSQLSNLPPVMFDGSCGVRSSFEVNPIYYFPTIEQQGLLYLPLLFHEVGHLFYRYHEPEMNDLVAELRQKIIDLLTPLSQRNDKFNEKTTQKLKIIAATWYPWIQELFCDAVGLIIGGYSYLFAFSSYLCTFSKEDFVLNEEDLFLSSHPLIYLRLRFLIKRAKELGFSNEADIVNKDWEKILQVMKVKEDYYGFYSTSFDESILSAIEDMLVEASPRKFRKTEIKTVDTNTSSFNSPVELFNTAWRKYLSNPVQYYQWEKKQIQHMLK